MAPILEEEIEPVPVFLTEEISRNSGARKKRKFQLQTQRKRNKYWLKAKADQEFFYSFLNDRYKNTEQLPHLFAALIFQQVQFY